MKDRRILDTADPSGSVPPDFLAIAANRDSKQGAIKQSSAQAIMVAGFASDGVATRAWSFTISDNDDDVGTYVKCNGIDEFGNDDLEWKRNSEGKVSREAQSAYKKALQNTFFNLPDSDPAFWTTISKAIPMARAIREEGMTATVVNGELKLKGGHSKRAAAMRNAKSLSALAKIAKGHGETLHRGEVRQQEFSGQAMPQSPIVELEATPDTIRPANSFQPLSKMASLVARASRASPSYGKGDDPVFASPSSQLPSAFHPAEGAEKLKAEIESSSGAEAAKKPAMLHVTVRLPRHVVERYPDLKAMCDDWVRFVENLPCTGEEAEIVSSFGSPTREENSGNGYSIRIIEKIKSADDSLLGVQFGLACIADDISVSEAARKLGVTRQTIYGWFLGTALPRKMKAAQIRAFLASRR